MIQCCDSLRWALWSGSEAGRVVATCLSPEMPSNVEKYQLIVLITLLVLPLRKSGGVLQAVA